MRTINLNEESILRAQAIGTLRIVLAVTAAGGRIQIEDEMGLIEYADSVSAAERRIAEVLMKGRPPPAAHLPWNPSDTVQ
jgi:hypothetical protein